MIQTLLDAAFHLSEVHHHTILVQLLRSAVNGDHPVMAVKLRALALIVDCQPVAGRDLNSLLYIVHISVLNNEIATQPFRQHVAKLLGFLMFL